MKLRLLPMAVMATLCIASASAQQAETANRMIVNLASGKTVAYSTADVTNVTFEEVGAIDVQLQFVEAMANSLTIACTKSEDCASAYLAAIASSEIPADADLKALVKEKAGVPTEFEEAGAQVTFKGLNEETNYTIIALGLDKWGIEGELTTIDALTTAVPVTDLDMVFELAYEGDKYEKQSGYFSLSLMKIYDSANATFDALNIEGFLPLEAGAALAEGTYTFENNETFSGKPFTFLSQHNIANQNFGTYFMSVVNGVSKYLIPAAGSIIKVEKDGTDYVVTANLVDADGEKRICVYRGAVEFPTGPKLKFEGALQQAEAQYAGKYVGQETEQIAVTFTGLNMSASDMAQTQMVLMFYTNSATELPEGTYNLVADYQKTPFTLQPGFFLGMGMPNPCYMYNVSQVYGENIVLLDQEGTVTVSKAGDNYTIDIKLIGTDLTSGEKAAVNYTYTGPLAVK